jgi:hypothetical protein
MAIEKTRSANEVHPIMINMRRDYTKVFDSDVANIGMLPGDLPQDIAGFYTRFSTVLDILKSYTDGVFSDVSLNPV